jgi:V/A-type H+-transporting ATPase subunit C
MMFGIKLPPLGGRAHKYGYSNARVKAMKGLILKPAILDEMIRVGNVEAMAELLQRTGYKSEIASASASYSGSMLIELAASRFFSKTARKLVRIAPASDREAINALLVRWDLMNIKTLLNARRLGKSYEDIRPFLFEVGGLDEDDFKRLLKAENSFHRELMKTGIGRKMGAVADEIGKGLRDDPSLESAIDSLIYMFMDRTLEQVGGKETSDIRAILRHEADAKNAMIIERLKRHGIPADKIRKSLINGGTLKEQVLKRLIDAKDMNATVGALKGKFPTLEMKGENSLTELEVALEKSIAAQKAVAFRRSILSAGVMFGFLLLKEEEVNNLRKIAKGKEFRMPEADVRAMLVTI